MVHRVGSQQCTTGKDAQIFGQAPMLTGAHYCRATVHSTTTLQAGLYLADRGLMATDESHTVEATQPFL